jgi:NTE family protein
MASKGVTMKALVLSGGSILGAFQAGAIAKVLSEGFVPDVVIGISVGALNGGFITNFIGEWRTARQPKVNAATKETMWQTAGQALHEFWTQNVRKPSDLLVPKSDLPISLLFGGQFNGIYDASPLYVLIDKTLKLEHMRHVETCKFLAGAVKMGNGQIKYVDQKSDDVISFIKAPPCRWCCQWSRSLAIFTATAVCATSCRCSKPSPWVRPRSR